MLDYAATYPNLVIRCHASDMTLHIDSDDAYLVLPNAKSRIAGFVYLSNADASTMNAPMMVTCKTLRRVVSSAAEAETSGVFISAQLDIPMRHTLMSLGHPQHPTPIKTDNSTTAGCININAQQKCSKSWDMRFHWLRDKETQKQISVCWDKGINNKADYCTKHHPTKYHLDIRRRNLFIRDHKI